MKLYIFNYLTQSLVLKNWKKLCFSSAAFGTLNPVDIKIKYEPKKLRKTINNKLSQSINNQSLIYKSSLLLIFKH